MPWLCQDSSVLQRCVDVWRGKDLILWNWCGAAESGRVVSGRVMPEPARRVKVWL